MTNATQAQIATASAIVARTTEIKDTVMPVVKHIAFTLATASVIVLKMVLFAIAFAANFLLEKLEANEITSDESLNAASEKIRVVSVNVFQQIQAELPGWVAVGVNYAVLRGVQLHSSLFDNDASEVQNA